MDDGNIAPKNPGEQEPNQYNKRVKTSSSNNTDARRPTKMPAIDNPTREKETSRSYIWRIVTQATQKSPHSTQFSGKVPPPPRSSWNCEVLSSFWLPMIATI